MTGNLGWDQQGSDLVLRVGGIDLLDDTPILDIKPYLPYADSIPDARGGYAETAPEVTWKVEFDEHAETSIAVLESDYPALRELIQSVLSQDPRPAWRNKTPDEKRYGMSLYDLNIKWRVEEDLIRVLSINREGI